MKKEKWSWNEEERLKIKDLVKAAHRNSNISTV